MKKKYYYIIGAVVLVAGGVLAYSSLRPNLKDQIVIPYIAHQKPAISSAFAELESIIGQAR